MSFLSSIVEWSLNHRPLILGLTFLFVIIGLNSARHLKIDAVPDVTTIQVQVITTAPALSPVEIEQYITFPIERAMSGIPRIEEVRSISRYGLSVITIVFKDNVDIYLARQLVNERLSDASSVIPPEYGKPSMGPISTGLGEIYQFSLSSEKYSLMELTTILNWYLSPLLKTVSGVVEVNTIGGQSKEYQITLSLDKMQALSISTLDIVDSLQKNNASMGGGYIEHNKEHYLIGTQGLLTSIDDLKKISIGKTKEGIPISLSSVADVHYGSRLRLGATTKDGKSEVVGAVVLMLMKENSLEVTESVKKKLDELRKTLPSEIKIEPFYDRTVMVKTTIKTVIVNLVEGALLVIIILLILLGSLRAGLVIAAVIPLAMMFAILIMNLRDAPANLMSMGAIDFGLVVDGAVIIIENSVRRLTLRLKEKGSQLTEFEKIETIRDATVEVRRATIFGEMIIAIVYFPIMALSGIEGKMFMPMALTVLYALGGAFILSLTLIPVLASYLLHIDDTEDHETYIFKKLKMYYIPILDKFLIHRNIVIGSMSGIFIGTVILFNMLGAEFMPQLDEGSMLLEIARLPSVALSESVQTSQKIERLLLKNIPEVISAVSKTGSPDIATDPMGLERTDCYLVLEPKERWRFDKEKLIDTIDDLLDKNIKEVSISVSQPIEMRTNELIAGIRSDIGVKIFGEDLKELKKIGEETAEILRGIQGVKDLKIEQLDGLSYIKIKPDRDKLARYGVHIADINQVTEMLSSGYKVGNIFEGNKRFEIKIRTEKLNEVGLDKIKSIPIKTSLGNIVPLGDLADVYYETGPVQISHENQYRRMLVEFNVRGRDMLSAVYEAEQKLQKVKLPIGYRFEYGGKYQNYISAKNTLMVVVPFTLMVILFFLWMAFGELTPALMIFLSIPFSISGGVIFLLIRDIPFSISAGVGFIALFGVAVLNGLVLISAAKELEHLGYSPHNAIVESAKVRLRPVLTTATVAAIGFIPMASSTSMGAEVQRPLATVVIGGLLTSSVLTLLVMPVVYSCYYDGCLLKIWTRNLDWIKQKFQKKN